jgi:hypothetical protein
MPPAAAPAPAAVVAAEPAIPVPAATPVAAAPATNEPMAVAPVTPEPVMAPATNSTPETTNTTPATAAVAPIVAPEPIATPPAAPPTNTTPPAAVPAEVAPAPAAATPANASTDIKPRIVTREGYVRKALNIQAPADFELRDLNSGKLIEYLQPDPKDKNFKKYTGIRVSVTGPEWLDGRWPKTPIIQVQTVDLMP